MARAFSETIAFACALLILSACQILTGLEQLHTPGSASPAAPTDVHGLGQSGQLASANQSGSGGNDPGATNEGPSQLTPGDGGVPITPSGGAIDAGGAQNQGNASNANPGTNNMPSGEPSVPTADAGPTMGLPATTTRKGDPVADGGAAQPSDGGMPTMPAMPTMPTIPADSGTTEPPPMDPPPPMCTPPFPGAACDTAPQCGCAQGENCAYLVTLDIPACVRAGTVGLNQHCDLATQCQVGLQCFGGACLELCDPAAAGCSNERGCTGTTSSGRPITGLYTCNSDCNLVDPQRQSGALASCGRDLTCVWFGDGTTCAYGGQSGGKHGMVCTDSFDCAPGYTCLDNGTCARWCVGSQDCPNGFSCEESDVTVADTRFGLCRPRCSDPRELSCETNPQCGCEDQMACDFISQSNGRNVHGCRDTGPIGPHEACDSDDDADCNAGTSCVGRICSPFCERDSECGGAYARCIQVVDSSERNEPPIPGFTVCRRPCDPANLGRPHGEYGACPSGKHCQVTTDGRSYCVESNSNAQWGDSCEGTDDCAIGHICTGTGCAPLCLSNSDCASGYLCSVFSPRLFAETTEWGVCIAAPSP